MEELQAAVDALETAVNALEVRMASLSPGDWAEEINSLTMSVLGLVDMANAIAPEAATAGGLQLRAVE